MEKGGSCQATACDYQTELPGIGKGRKHWLEASQMNGRKAGTSSAHYFNDGEN